LKKTPLLYLNDIAESIAAIESHIGAMSEEKYLEDIKTRDSVERRLEIIGEAVKKLDDETKKIAPLVPWKKIAGLRDILAHAYSTIEQEKIWEIVKNDLQPLKIEVRAMLKKHKK
jgi:uncharacterized protein with HEPN domain